MDLQQRLMNRIRATVQRTPVTDIPADLGDGPYVTHEGLVPLGEDTIQMSRLNTGEEIVTAESLEALLNGPLGAWLAFLRVHPEWEDAMRFAPADLPGIKPGELSARPAAVLAFSPWMVAAGLAQHPERLPAMEQTLKYQVTLERQASARRQQKLRLIRPRPQPE